MKKSIGAKTILYPTPVLVVGSYDKDNKPNVMTASWGGLCCSAPPCVAVALREATYTYHNLMERRAFTVSIPSSRFMKETDFFGLASGKTQDKFARTGLTPTKSDVVDAPYVQEFPVVLECKIVETVKVGLHTQFIGEIKNVRADEGVLNDAGIPDMIKVDPLIFSPYSRDYHSVGKVLDKAFAVGRSIE